MAASISIRQRRALITCRHHLLGTAANPVAAAGAVLGLHATDAASVYLAVLARDHRSTIADIRHALHDNQTLVRWLAMRRTLFVLPRVDVPLVHAAASVPLSHTLRKHLINRIERAGTEPQITGDTDTWLRTIEGQVMAAVEAQGGATGMQLSTMVPALRTKILGARPSDWSSTLTSPLLVLMGADGYLLRSDTRGSWVSRSHRWQATSGLWPMGIPVLPTVPAQAALVQRWLRVFGPGTFEDIVWWTGWTKNAVRQALALLQPIEVDLDGQPGIAVGDMFLDMDHEPEPAVTLLPALDATPMGWRQRDWFMGVDKNLLFDPYGNIGPSIWWRGEIIGGWAVGPDGEVRTRILADRGSEVVEAAQRAAEYLGNRLGGTVVKPAFRTPLERTLSA